MEAGGLSQKRPTNLKPRRDMHEGDTMGKASGISDGVLVSEGCLSGDINVIYQYPVYASGQMNACSFTSESRVLFFTIVTCALCHQNHVCLLTCAWSRSCHGTLVGASLDNLNGPRLLSSVAGGTIQSMYGRNISLRAVIH